MYAGHKDSVTCTGFSHDSKYIATADMGGLVQVWGVTTAELVWSFETGGDIEVGGERGEGRLLTLVVMCSG